MTESHSVCTKEKEIALIQKDVSYIKEAVDDLKTGFTSFEEKTSLKVYKNTSFRLKSYGAKSALLSIGGILGGIAALILSKLWGK